MATAHEIPCYPVPHYPGYCINRRGQVFGPRGMLKIDENYRCTLYRKRHPKPLYVGEIMELVGLLRSESTVEELEDQARKLAVLQEENAALHQELEEAARPCSGRARSTATSWPATSGSAGKSASARRTWPLRTRRCCRSISAGQTT